MQCLLEEKGLWDHVTGQKQKPPPNPEEEKDLVEWVEADTKAK
jgi:hypothetical protein